MAPVLYMGYLGISPQPNRRSLVKTFTSFLILAAALALSGCASETAASSNTRNIVDCAIEIQIAVVSGQKPGHKMSDGDWAIAASCVLPVQSTGGPGSVVCSTDGTIIRIRWQDVRQRQNRVEFGSFEWTVGNRIDRRDGTSQTLGGQLVNAPTPFGTEFEWLADCEIDTGLAQRTGRRLVIRGRLLPEPPSASPLKLEEMAGL